MSPVITAGAHRQVQPLPVSIGSPFVNVKQVKNDIAESDQLLMLRRS